MNKTLSARLISAGLFAALALSSTAHACFAYKLVGSGDIKNSSKAYAGLNWSLGGSATPSVVLGVMNARVKENGNTQGANLLVSFSPSGGVIPAKVSLGYLSGKPGGQGEARIGYDLTTQSPLFGLGGNMPNVSLGGEWSTAGALTPYLTLHSQGRFEKADGQRCELDPLMAPTSLYSNATCTILRP